MKHEIKSGTDSIHIVPARICGHCGLPLSRYHVEPGQQSVGVCLRCRTEDDTEEFEPPVMKAAFPVMVLLCIGFWIVVLVWLARGMGWL